MNGFSGPRMVAGLLTWPDYLSTWWPHAVRIEHRKNKALVWHPLEETIDGETVKFYAEAEDILIHLPNYARHTDDHA